MWPVTPTSEARIVELLEKLVAATQPRPALMDAAAVARELGVAVRTVQRLRQMGKLPPPISIGGQIRWRRADLERFLHEQ